MKLIVFKIHLCGMSNKTLLPKLLIDKPFKRITKIFDLHLCKKKGVITVNDLIQHIKHSERHLVKVLGNFGLENFIVDNIYIKYNGYFVGFQHDKSLEDVFDYFNKGIIELNYVVNVGGASRIYRGYKFIIHSNEEIHKNTPHVHVEKNGISTRYRLDPIERITSDKCSSEHLRDEKKIIKPYIEDNIEWFKEKWLLSINGYKPPIENEEGFQYLFS